MASVPPYENNLKLNLTNLSDISEFLSSSKILGDCIQVQKKKERNFFPCVGHKTRLESFTS